MVWFHKQVNQLVSSNREVGHSGRSTTLRARWSDRIAETDATDQAANQSRHDAVQRRDITYHVADILIRDVPDDVVATLDANAQRAGLTRAEYLRRVLAAQQGRVVTREDLNRFAKRTTDLGNPEVMAAAWR